jgi:hypothetical protein
MARMMVPYNNATGDDEIADVRALVDSLNRDLVNEGYTFEFSGNKVGDNFYRVYASHGGGGYGQYGAFLDLRLGMLSPKGRTIEMMTGKPGTYGMPGFARHIYGQADISQPYDTFKDYVRSVFEFASNEGKSPNEVKWTVYQEGFEGRDLPGSEEFGIDSYEATMFPSIGGILTKSSSQAQRVFMASAVRPFLPRSVEPRDYVADIIKQMKAKSGAPLGLYGYVPTSKYGWVPGGTSFMTAEDLVSDEPNYFVALPNAPGKAAKSTTSWVGSRNMANVPLVKDPNTGRLVKVQPSMPERGYGFRRGWTMTSGPIATEQEPRMVYSAQVAMLDMPDMPGAMLASKGAFSFYGKTGIQPQEGVSPKLDTYAIGEKGEGLYEFNVTTVDDFWNLVDKGKLKFFDVQGKQVKPGDGKYSLGHYWREGAEGKPGQWKDVYIDKRSYGMSLNKPTLHIPEFYNPTVQGGAFSNLPVMKPDGKTLSKTDKLVAQLRQTYGDTVNIVQYSGIGVGTEESPAAAYLTYDFERITPVSTKSGRDFKGFVAQKGYSYELEYLGEEGSPQRVDFMTSETKIPVGAIQGSFQIMNMKTQQSFLKTFLPKGLRESAAVRKMQQRIEEAYDSPLPGGNVNVDPNLLAEEWSEATKTETTADQLFKIITNNILNVTDRKKAKKYREMYGLGFLTDQWVKGNVYAPGRKDEFMRLLRELPEADRANIDWEDFFEEYPELTSADLRVDENTEIKNITPVQLKRMRFKASGGGNALAIQAALNFVPEYQSSSGFMNKQAIMDLIENFPAAAREVGLMDDSGGWGGVFNPDAYGAKGVPDPATVGAQSMLYYLEYQKSLLSGGEVVPGDTVGLSPKLAADISGVIEDARRLYPKNNKEQINYLRDQLKILSKGAERYGLDKSTRLDESFFLDPHSGTLIPKIDAVTGLEHYKPGVLEGVTETWLGDSYMRLLDAATQSATSSPGAQMTIIGSARDRFLGRANNYFFPDGRRSKPMFRHITGMDLPGSRGGRYQGMTELESGEAYASDNYIIRALAAGGFKNSRQIRSILNYMNSSPDAFLPIQFQRYPDLSGNVTFMPMKLRSQKHLVRYGVPPPEGGPNSEDLLYISDTINRFQVGDFDADPYMTKIMPIFQTKDTTTGKLIDEWAMGDATREEFERKFSFLYSPELDNENKTRLDRVLEDQFGERGTQPSQESLDQSRKTVSDYSKAMRTVGSIRSRTADAQWYPIADVLDAYTSSYESGAGKGVSYIARTEVMDIASTVLGMSGRSVDIFKKAYESMALPYQLYLDLNKKMLGGFTQLETMLNTYGIYGIEKQGNATYYRLNYKLTNQGSPVELDPNKWAKAGGTGVSAEAGMLINKLMNSTAQMPEELMTNDALAMGWSTPGNEEAVLNALKNPEKFWQEAKYGAETVNALSSDVVRSRSAILGELYTQGKVGWGSNYYTALTYRAIERLRRTTPSEIQNEKIMLPWMNGEVMPIKDIVKTREFMKWDLAETLFVRGAEAPTPEQMELLNQIGGFRMLGMLSGIRKDYEIATGGMRSVESAGKEYGQRLKDAFKVWQESRLTRSPIVHASELGSVLKAPKFLQDEGWQSAPDEQSIETQYRIGLSMMGFPFLMTGHGKAGTHFRRVNWIAGGESLIDKGPIGGGIDFEREFNLAHPAMQHIGRVSEEGIIKFQLGNITMHGTPDFVNLDDDGNVVITDTKSPAPTKNTPYTQDYAEAKAKQYRYRIQQLSYAYGLQSMARNKDTDWDTFMESWNIRDKDTKTRIRLAASAGKIKLFIQPGRYTTDTGLEEYTPIEIPYNDDTKRELVAYGQAFEKKIVDRAMIGEVAQKSWEALGTGNVPEALTGYAFTSKHVDMDLFSGLKEYAKRYFKGTRASGGGSFRKGSRMRVRVGEGGPEELLIGEEGVEVIPTHELAESRMAQGLDPTEVIIGATAREGDEFGFEAIAKVGGKPGRKKSKLPTGSDVIPTETSLLANAVAASAPATATGIGGGAIITKEDLRKSLGELFSEKVDLTVRFPNRTVSPYEGTYNAQVGTLLQSIRTMEPSIREVASGTQDILKDWFTSVGKEGMITSLLDLPTTGEQYDLALLQGMSSEDFVSRAAKKTGLVGAARKVSKVSTMMNKLNAVITRAGGVKEMEGLDKELPELQLLKETAKYLDTSTTEGAQYAQQLGQVGSVAGTIVNLQKDITEAVKEGKPGGAKDIYSLQASPESVNRYIASFDKMTEAHGKYNEALEKGKKVHEAQFELDKQRLQVGIDLNRMQKEDAQARAGNLRKDDRWLTPTEVQALPKGEVDLTMRKAAAAARAYEQSEIQKGEQLGKLIERGTSGGGGMEAIAGFGRKMLGGFGLMYMQSIAGIIGAKAMEGYPEAEQNQMLAFQALGGLTGGFDPYTSAERRIAQTKRMAGGLGGFGIRSIYAKVLEDPTLSMALGMGQTALGAASFGMFGAASLGLTGATIAATGGIAAAIAVPSILAAGTYGAMLEPELSASSLAAQASKGKAGELSFAQMGMEWQGPGGQISKNLKDIQFAQQLIGYKPSITFQQLRSDLGWDREEYVKQLRMYSETLAKTFTTAPEYTYQAVRLKEAYQIPLSEGGIERMAGILEQGMPVQQLGEIAGWSPYATGAERRFAAGRVMADIVGHPDRWTEERQAYLQQGASFVQSLGYMAPNITGSREVTTPGAWVDVEVTKRGTDYKWKGGGGIGEMGWYPEEKTWTELERVWQDATVDIVSNMAEYEARIGETLSTSQEALITKMVAVEESKRLRGQEYTSSYDIIKAVGAMTPAQMDFQMRATKVDQIMGNALDRLEQTFIQLGDLMPNMERFSTMTMGQVGFYTQAAQYGQQLEQTLIGGGVAPKQAQMTGRTYAALAQLDPQLATRMAAAGRGDVREMVALMQKYPEMSNIGGTITGVGGTEIAIGNLNFAAGLTGPGGQLSGLSWGRANLETPAWSGQQVANMIWGPESSWAGKGYNADIINQMITGGTRSVETAQARLGFQYQQAQAGMQMEQIALQKWYMPQQFALQERGRNLSYAQAEWGFQQQEQQLALGQQNFAFQTGMQQRQMGLQRGWQREDWAYNEQVRGLQWQWKQEDYGENLRFMTGRDRRLAERQMGRETTMHDLESEQIEKQKGRQKELWAMEDERFNQQIAYQTALFKMQEENLSKQKDFFEQNKAIQEESADLQEEYWKRSIALQEKAAGIAASIQ